MARDLRAYLWDIEQAAADIQAFTEGKRLSDYEKDAMLRAAVERKFEILGEALSQALRYFPAITPRITNPEQIIAFRNRLIHGYATVSNTLVWDIVQANVPVVRKEATNLLRDLEEQK
jgi:uncharacterized protein with HEPN domain